VRTPGWFARLLGTPWPHPAPRSSRIGIRWILGSLGFQAQWSTGPPVRRKDNCGSFEAKEEADNSPIFAPTSRIHKSADFHTLSRLWDSDSRRRLSIFPAVGSMSASPGYRRPSGRTGPTLNVSSKGHRSKSETTQTYGASNFKSAA
jgi:hypothetical protein